MYIPSIDLLAMVLGPDAVVTVVVFGYGLLAGALTWLWKLSAKHTKFILEHEALKLQSAQNAAEISAVETSLSEVKTMMREERHQMGRMSSKIDLLVSVLVSRSDASVSLEQIMAVMEKDSSK